LKVKLSRPSLVHSLVSDLSLFFPADVLAIIYAFYVSRYFFVPLVVGLVSLFSYFPFLFCKTVIELYYLAMLMAAMLVRVTYPACGSPREDKWPHGTLTHARLLGLVIASLQSRHGCDIRRHYAMWRGV
jgi:hypothetical protein